MSNIKVQATVRQLNMASPAVQLVCRVTGLRSHNGALRLALSSPGWLDDGLQQPDDIPPPVEKARQGVLAEIVELYRKVEQAEIEILP